MSARIIRFEPVTKAVVPAAPNVYAGKTLHLEPEFCYSLDGPGKCTTTGKEVIQVFGTRIRRVGF